MADAESPSDASAWRRRMAIQLVAQLPDNREDALAVLSYAKDIISDFIYQPARAARLTLVAPADQPVDKPQGKP